MPRYNAQNVWQRVHAAPQAPTQEAGRILALIPDLQACAQSTANHKDLSPAFRKQAAALRGIYALLSGEPAGSVGQPPVGGHPVRSGSPIPSAVLRKCYTIQLRSLTEYQDLCGHPEYGPAFQVLIPLAQESCLNLLALLGS